MTAQGQKFEQPRPVMGMTIAPGGNRNAKSVPLKSNGQRGWSHGLCDCFGDRLTCCHSCLCPCIIYSTVKGRVEFLNANGRPDPAAGGNGCDGDCILHCCLTCFFCAGWILHISNRGVVRQRYNIEGNSCEDCLTAFCCTPCELTQESREIELEEQSLMH